MSTEQDTTTEGEETLQDTTTEPQDAATEPEGTEQDTEGTETEEQADESFEDGFKPRESARAAKEAAKYRLRAQEAEAERDALRETVAGLQQTIVTAALSERVRLPTKPEDLAPEVLDKRVAAILDGSGYTMSGYVQTYPYRLIDTDAFWKLTGNTPADLIAANGTVDMAKLTTELARLKASSPYLFEDRSPEEKELDGRVARGLSSQAPDKPGGNAWEDGFKPKERR
ncbi:hypothetical protein SAMN06298212_10567 [Ruaniaceae bacterium KH17]|nr:hypothetical protein SAMN06298212_10567 [Ruaniaceae bacterium KH17]